MLEIKEISVAFDRPVLKNISLTAKKGQIIGLVGKSGAGKSTLLNVISGQLGPQHGSINLTMNYFLMQNNYWCQGMIKSNSFHKIIT